MVKKRIDKILVLLPDQQYIKLYKIYVILFGYVKLGWDLGLSISHVLKICDQ